MNREVEVLIEGDLNFETLRKTLNVEGKVTQETFNLAVDYYRKVTDNISDIETSRKRVKEILNWRDSEAWRHGRVRNLPEDQQRDAYPEFKDPNYECSEIWVFGDRSFLDEDWFVEI